MILVVIWKCYFEDGNAATAMEEAEKKGCQGCRRDVKGLQWMGSNLEIKRQIK